MRAVLCTAFEGIRSLIIGETSEPRPKPDEVLIDVHAASVSYLKLTIPVRLSARSSTATVPIRTAKQ